MQDPAALIRSGKAPAGITVAGDLAFETERKTDRLRIPDGMTVGRLDLSKWAGAIELGAGLDCYELDLSNTSIERLPDDLKVRCRLDLAECEDLVELPTGLTVGSLNVRGCTGMMRLPENLDVWFLDLSGCWAFEDWPQRATIRGGNLRLSGCVALRNLPHYLNRIANLDVRHCSNLSKLADDLVVSGWIDLAHSGLIADGAQPLPQSLHSVSLRWAGAPIDRRIAFEPHLISAREIVNQKNAEIRRAMLDRVGLSRFLTEVEAENWTPIEIPAARAELIRMKLEADEDLVALSCLCPSTGRQYMIRVPPKTATCNAAAAWIAGFDNPDDYRPDIET